MTDIEKLRELLDEKEYPIAADTPLGRYAVELRNAIGPLLDRVEMMARIEATVRLHIEDLRKTATALADIEIPGMAKCGKEFTTAADELEAALRGKGK